mgnify:CR=1 FL=1
MTVRPPMLSDLEIEILRRAQAGMERPRPPITVGPVRPSGPVIPFAGAGEPSAPAPQTQFGGYGATMPTTPLMQYAGLNPTKERAPQPDPIVLPPPPMAGPAPAPEPAPTPAPTPPPPPVVSDPGGGSTSGPTAPGSDYQAGLKYTDSEGPTGYYPGPTPDRPKPPPAPVIPDNASDYGKDVLERAADSNLPPEVVVAMDQQKENPNAKIDINIGTFDPTSSKEDLRLSSAPAKEKKDQSKSDKDMLPKGVTSGGKYYNDPITGNRMYQPPMPKRRPGTMGAQVMPAPIDLTTGKPKESPFGGMLPPAKPTPPKKTPPKKTPPKKTPPKRPTPPRKAPPKPVSGDRRKGSGRNRPVRGGPVTKGPRRSKPVPPKKTPPKRTPPKKPSPPRRPPSSIFDRLPSSGPTGYSV